MFAADTTALHHNIFASALRDKNNNVEINEKYWRQKINENKLIKHGEVLNRYAGKVDSATIERFQRQYDTAYENVYQAIKDMDTNMLTEDALARQATADRAFGAKSFEKIRFYRNAFGDRGLNNILDIIAKVQSEPEYRALISRDPAFAPLLQLEGVEPGTFSRVLDEALALTIDPTKGKKDMTSEQQAALDLYLQQSARQSSDEEADSITKGLQSSDQEKKAFSYVVNRGRANATPEGIKVFNNRWNSFAADARQDLVDAIIDNRQPIDLFVTPEGLDARITRDRAGRQVDTAPAVNSELGQIIAEYNKFKQAYDTGWKNDMKVKNYDVLLEDVVRVVEQQASPVIDNLELIDTLNSGRLGSGRSRGLRSQDDNDAVNAFNALSGNEKELILPYLTQTARSKIGNIIITDSDAQLMEEFNASDPLDREAMRREAGLE
ncbi:MAG: hypothetical protein JSW41_04625 [Candidatus Aenigmatarchaeota archaeon]|nr:MAG: hypothetical protein JSW41_04625 [Candidatus Aenigmarchaeota archaeon]